MKLSRPFSNIYQHQKLVAIYANDKKSNIELVNSLVQMIKAQNPTWEQDEFIAPAVQYLLTKS